MNADHLFQDLKSIRWLGWHRREQLGKLELLKHRAVRECAKEPKELPQLIDSLRDLLIRCCEDLRRTEVELSVAEGRSVAIAARALLRLDAERDEQDLKEVRKEIVKVWLGPRGFKVNERTFANHHQDPEVTRPFAEAVHAFLATGPRDLPGPDLPEIGAPRSAKQRQMVEHLKEMEERTRAGRIRELELGGTLKIRNQTEMLDVLRTLNRLARRSLRAVDQNPVTAWMGNTSLNTHLDEQLACVKRKKRLELERIYVVDPATRRDEKKRELLREFAERHRRVGARLLFCSPREAGKYFKEERGLLLADSEKDPIGVTGRMSHGSVGEAAIYTWDQTALQDIQLEYDELLERMSEGDFDKELKGELELQG